MYSEANILSLKVSVFKMEWRCPCPKPIFKPTTLYGTIQDQAYNDAMQWRIGRREHRDVSRWPDGPPGLTWTVTGLSDWRPGQSNRSI